MQQQKNPNTKANRRSDRFAGLSEYAPESLRPTALVRGAGPLVLFAPNVLFIDISPSHMRQTGCSQLLDRLGLVRGMAGRIGVIECIRDRSIRSLALERMLSVDELVSRPDLRWSCPIYRTPTRIERWNRRIGGEIESYGRVGTDPVGRVHYARIAGSVSGACRCYIEGCCSMRATEGIAAVALPAAL